MNIKDFENEYFKVIGEHEITDKTVVKFGIDPTSPDIHLGHLVVLRQLRRLQGLGVRVALIIGDLTASVGDPSGKDATRPLLDKETIKNNFKLYMTQVCKILDPTKVYSTYNSGLSGSLEAADMITLLSKITLSKLLEHNTFRQRVDASESIRVHELLYPLLQAYDSLCIKPDIEVGGMDQRFNFTITRDIQASYGVKQQSCLLCPILLGTDGVNKMSKSLNNYIGVAEDPDTMRDKLSRMPDSNVKSYMDLLTDLDFEGFQDILDAKKQLIYEIISLTHGRRAAIEAMNKYGRKKKAI